MAAAEEIAVDIVVMAALSETSCVSSKAKLPH